MATVLSHEIVYISIMILPILWLNLVTRNSITHARELYSGNVEEKFIYKCSGMRNRLSANKSHGKSVSPFDLFYNILLNQHLFILVRMFSSAPSYTQLTFVYILSRLTKQNNLCFRSETY